MNLKIEGLILLILLVSVGSSQDGYLLPSPAGLQTSDLQTSGFQIGNETDWLGFPWYSSNISFYYGFNATPEMSQAFSFFSQYYIDTGAPIVGGIISTPVRYEITQQPPSTVYFAGGQQVPYSQYTSTALPRGNELWVQGESGWSQYIVAPVGTWLQLIAYSPEGGNAGFYEIVQTSTTSVKYRTYQLYPGYNRMDFYADQAGRHILLFVVNNRPSNAVIVDALYQSPPSTEVVLPEPSPITPPSYVSTSPAQPLPQPVPTTGDTPVTVRYPSMRNIDVYVDGQYVGSGLGSVGFRVPGGMNHEITVWDGSWYYQRDLYFAKGIPKIIYVEAV
ncbi:MAG TPA: hypothetical protein VLB04_12260 [Methanotrichaceae archaeon]|nr:hypothetical protein [Methanotrichaceae archaeon]